MPVMTEILTCLYCGDLLTGRQKKYCSDSHRQAHNRRLASEKRADSAESGNAENQAPPNVVSIQEYSAVVASNQGLQVKNELLADDLTRLRGQVDTLSTDNTRLTSESAESRGALAAERRFNRLLLIAAAVALGLLIVLTLLVAAGVV